MLVSLTLSIPLSWKNTLMKRRGGLAVVSVPVRTGKNNLLQHTSKTMLHATLSNLISPLNIGHFIWEGVGSEEAYVKKNKEKEEIILSKNKMTWYGE